MRTIVYLVATLAVATAVMAQVRPSPQKWKATVTVVDDAGQPVPGAEVIIGFAVPPPPDESTASATITGLTDAVGMFTASHTDRSVYLSFQARKSGYYPFGIQHELGFSPQNHRERLRPNVTLVLKRIINPIPMYAKWVKSGPPVFNQPVAYDLAIGDWTAPHGKGMHTDIIFLGQLDKKSDDDFEYRLTVSFANAGDGIQEFASLASPAGEGSRLRSPREAPLEGYQPQVIRDQSRRPGRSSTFDYDEKRNYFFRVRTVLDEDGNVKSAHYGKIYGDFMKFRYYLNPTPNDRNVEFDPKRNLLTGLKSTERVDAP